jgi:hypothetical protein
MTLNSKTDGKFLANEKHPARGETHTSLTSHFPLASTFILVFYRLPYRIHPITLMLPYAGDPIVLNLVLLKLL